MFNKDKISVLVINRNYGHFLKSCLDSVLEQGEAPHEIVLVDDGSTDKSVEVAESYGKAIRLFRRSAEGIYSAQKFGVEQVTGDWIITLDSDDMLLPHCVQAVRSRISPRLSRISYRLGVLSEAGRNVGEEPSRKFSVPEGYVGDYWSRGWEVAAPPGSGNAYPRGVMGQAFESRNTDFLNKGYYPQDRWLQTIASFEGECAFIPDVCGIYRIHGESVEGSSFETSRLLSRIEGHHGQASYLVARYKEMGREVQAVEILAFRYYYWWLRVLYWFASSGSDVQSKDGRLFLIARLLECIFYGPQKEWSIRCSRLAKAVSVALLPRSRSLFPMVAKLNRFARVRGRKTT